MRSWIHVSWSPSLNAFLIFVYSAFVFTVVQIFIAPRITSDAQIYLAMANDPFSFTEPPWGYRILTPWIAYVIPTDPLVAFRIITILALSATAGILYLYISSLLDSQRAFFGTFLFLLSPVCIFNLTNPYLVDALYYLTATICLYLVFKQQWKVLILVLTVGVLVKESIMLMFIPLAVIGFLEHRFKPQLMWALLAICPVMMYIVLHFTPIFFGNVPTSYNHFTKDNFEFVSSYIHRWGSVPKVFVASFIQSYGPFWLLLPFYLKQAHPFIVYSATFLIPCVCTFAIATDWPRMLYPAFIVVAPAASVLVPNGALRSVIVLFLFGLQNTLVSQMSPSVAKYVLELLVIIIICVFVLNRKRSKTRSAESVHTS